MEPEFGLKRPDQVKTAPDQGRGERVPPGQFVSQKFPVLTHGSTPWVDLKTWKIRVFGLVEQEIELDWEEFTKLDWVAVAADFHCVTQWSSQDNRWEGVPFATLVGAASPRPEARYVMAHCYGGYTTNLPLDIAMEEGLLAHKQNGEELGSDHGWPLRLIIPSRYAWKSAKWVNGIELLAEDSPGFWEQRGYSNNADPWKEERFWPELTK
ncbi:MAG TPA: sulfite oxidase-like oxidoreductase [Dehalococcoidia bacterium]|jgi:DMSO/TMAO reductase YedYZ molybdopterin-dependent catalytic subunit|nr:sulfite oxidase-like oxidoreductase [Dehalococcoidia bacterium]